MIYLYKDLTRTWKWTT